MQWHLYHVISLLFRKHYQYLHDYEAKTPLWKIILIILFNILKLKTYQLNHFISILFGKLNLCIHNSEPWIAVKIYNWNDLLLLDKWNIPIFCRHTQSNNYQIILYLFYSERKHNQSLGNHEHWNTVKKHTVKMT